MQKHGYEITYEYGGVVWWLAGCFTPGPVTIWIGDCLQTDKISRYATNHLGQLSLPSLPLGKSNILVFLAGVKAGYVYLCRVAGNTVGLGYCSVSDAMQLHVRWSFTKSSTLLNLTSL